MVKYRNVCAVTNCQKNGSKEPLLMHSLDSSSTLGKIWYLRAKYGVNSNSDAYNNLPYEPTNKRIFICENHFLGSDYENQNCTEFKLSKVNRKRLKKTALPSVNLPNGDISIYGNLPLKENSTSHDVMFNLIDNDSSKENFNNSELEECSSMSPHLFSTKDNISNNKSQFKKTKVLLKKEKNESRANHKKRKVSTNDKHQDMNEDYLLTTETTDTSQPKRTLSLIQSNKHCLNLMKSLYSDEALMDVFLVVDNKTARAHRAILRQASGYFRQVLSLDTTLECEVRLRDISFEMLVKILRFIYMGETSMPPDKVYEFFEAAKLLDVFSLLPDNSESRTEAATEIKEEQTCNSSDNEIEFNEVSNVPEELVEPQEEEGSDATYAVTDVVDSQENQPINSVVYECLEVPIFEEPKYTNFSPMDVMVTSDEQNVNYNNSSNVSDYQSAIIINNNSNSASDYPTANYSNVIKDGIVTYDPGVEGGHEFIPLLFTDEQMRIEIVSEDESNSELKPSDVCFTQDLV